MRAVVQRVQGASVSVDGEVVGKIDGQGLCVLVGVTHEDTAKEAEVIARKIATLRILDEEKSAIDVGAQVLIISQFTLYGDARKGRRPTWQNAAPGAVAEPLVDQVAQILQEQYKLHVQTGRFGANMQVSLVNDGPVTILLEA